MPKIIEIKNDRIYEEGRELTAQEIFDYIERLVYYEKTLQARVKLRDARLKKMEQKLREEGVEW